MMVILRCTSNTPQHADMSVPRGLKRIADIDRRYYLFLLLALTILLSACGDGAPATIEETPTPTPTPAEPECPVPESQTNSRVAWLGAFGIGGDPGMWEDIEPMAFQRELHSATQLPGGLMLVTGGNDGSDYKSTEMFNVELGGWGDIADLNEGRYLHSATLLDNGLVLVAGGVSADRDVMNSAELFDPETEGWYTTGSMNVARRSHSATLLEDGRVLVVGGIRMAVRSCMIRRQRSGIV